MLKNISDLGTTLNQFEQQSINGGDKDYPNECSSNEDCLGHELCNIRDHYCYQPT